jgi:hypothetical protein
MEPPVLVHDHPRWQPDRIDAVQFLLTLEL